MLYLFKEKRCSLRACQQHHLPVKSEKKTQLKETPVHHGQMGG